MTLVVVSNSWFVILQRQRVLGTVSDVFDRAFWGIAKKFHITLEKSNILKISVKKTNFFKIEGKKSFVGPFYIGCNLKK